MKHLFIVALTLAFNVFAEENTGTTEETAAAPGASDVYGTIDIRPTYTGLGNNGSWKYGTENLAEVGYKFDANRILSYRQEFNTNIFDPNASRGGVDPSAQGGFLRGRLKNLWVSENSDWNLGWEGRAYIPTNTESRDAGMIFALRNYGILTYKLTDTVEVSLFEVPIVHMYDRAGHLDKANPSFENRAYLDVFANLSDRITLEVPLMLNSVRSRSYQVADAAGNLSQVGDSWGHKLWVYPELLYKIDPTYTVGVSYYSDNLMSPDLATFNIGDGLEKGSYQLVFIANL